MFRSRDTRRIVLACGIIVAAGIAAYSNTLHAPFVFDGLTLERRFATTTLSTDPTTWFGVHPRTIGFFTFDLQNTLHGAWIPGFHAVNIAIHVAAAVLLFAAVLVTCRGPQRPADIRRDALGIALLAALVFELHPLQTQAVTYVYQRFESLMGMWFLAAVAAFAWAVRDDAARFHRFRHPAPDRRRRRAALGAGDFAARQAAHYSSRQWPRIYLEEFGSVGLLQWREARLQQARKAHG